ncbi:MAG: hypothetical protein RIC55_30155 [Pirellulaceae bacterium]
MPPPPPQLRTVLGPVCGRLKLQSALDLSARAAATGAALALALAMCRVATTDSWPTIAALVVLVVSPLVGLALAMLRPANWRAAARAVDDRYQLADRTTTALAVHQTASKRPMATLALRDALQRLQRVKAGEVVRLRPPRGLGAAAGLSLVALAAALAPLDWSKYFPAQGATQEGAGDHASAASIAPAPTYAPEVFASRPPGVAPRLAADRTASAWESVLDERLIVRRYFDEPAATP